MRCHHSRTFLATRKLDFLLKPLLAVLLRADPELFNEIGTPSTFDMLQSDLIEQEDDDFRPPVDSQRAPSAMSAGSFSLRVRTKLKRLQLQ